MTPSAVSSSAAARWASGLKESSPGLPPALVPNDTSMLGGVAAGLLHELPELIEHRAEVVDGLEGPLSLQCWPGFWVRERDSSRRRSGPHVWRERRLSPPIQIGGCGVGLGLAVCPLALKVEPSWTNSSSLQTPRITSMASSKSALRCSKSTPSARYSPRT